MPFISKFNFLVPVRGGLLFYRRSHLLLGLLAALTVAILAGALLTGETLHYRLRGLAAQKTGGYRTVLYRPNTSFSPTLQAAIEKEAPGACLFLAHIPGELLDEEGNLLSARVNVYGTERPIPLRTAVANKPFAASGSLRLFKPDGLPPELPLARNTAGPSVRISLDAITTAADGLPLEFSLTPGSSARPDNLFVSLPQIAAAFGSPVRPNLLLTTEAPERIAAILSRHLTPADIGLSCSNSILRSSAIYIPEAVTRTFPAARTSLAHLADEFSSGTNATPYGFVLTSGTRTLASQWLADRLQLSTGSELLLKWRYFTPDNRLAVTQTVLRIEGVIPMAEAVAYKSRMPEFPGLATADSCTEWDIGLPMDEAKLADTSNEDYWKAYRETPKLIVPAELGPRLFGTVFGSAMTIETESVPNVSPQAAGWILRDLQAEGALSAKGSVDFTGLFGGMTFVLIVSALILCTLSFSLSLVNRRSEIALLFSLGHTRRRVFAVLAAEHAVPALLGACVGMVPAVLFSRVLNHLLAGIWRGAAADAAVGKMPLFSPVIPLAAAGLFLTLVLIAFVVIRRLLRNVSLIGLLREVPQTGLSVWNNRIGSVCAVAGGILFFMPSDNSGLLFFGAGFCLMVSLVCFCRSLFAFPVEADSPLRAALRSLAFHPGRTLAVLLPLAFGAFLSFGILAMKPVPNADGTGGFDSCITSALPQKKEFRIPDCTTVVPFRVLPGDETTCLNLNRTATPKILGADCDLLSQLRAFEPDNAGGIWRSIEYRGGEVIPALAGDRTTLEYGLKLKPGDEITVQGRRIRILGSLPERVTILQGVLIIDEKAFAGFGVPAGYTFFLAAGTEPPARLPGLDIVPAREKLRLLQQVESTYLDMFLLLGSLGVILGLFGITLLILRAIADRRMEFAVLSALGHTPELQRRLLFFEYGILSLCGIASGVLPALLAIQPVARKLGHAMPWLLLAALFAGLVCTAALTVLWGCRPLLKRTPCSLLQDAE